MNETPQSIHSQMTTETCDNRIVRAAQRFFDSITFSLNEENNEIKPIETTNNLNESGEENIMKKRRVGWFIGELIIKDDFSSFSERRRLLFTTQKGSPFLFSSFSPFRATENFDSSNFKNFHYLDLSFIGESNDKTQTRRITQVTRSFGHLLNVESSSSSSGSDSSEDSSNSSSSSSSSSSSDDDFDFVSGPSHYDPIFLDDPNLKTGKHRTVLALPSFLGSISHYISGVELKRELNDQFRQKHPDIHPSLTLSQIRSLKQSLLDTALALNIELSTVAKSYAYFEKLLLCGKVIKLNRKIVGACSLILAVKVNDSRTVSIERLVEELSKRLNLPDQQQIISHEFTVFAALKFSLHLPQHEYMPHFERIFTHLEFDSFQEYLGERMYHTWNRNQTATSLRDYEDEEEELEGREERPILVNSHQ